VFSLLFWSKLTIFARLHRLSMILIRFRTLAKFDHSKGITVRRGTFHVPDFLENFIIASSLLWNVTEIRL
jgi:hypothetical protein